MLGFDSTFYLMSNCHNTPYLDLYKLQTKIIRIFLKIQYTLFKHTQNPIRLDDLQININHLKWNLKNNIFIGKLQMWYKNALQAL
jgi:hypothetical protein